MAKTPLVGPDVDEGRRFLELLKTAGVQVQAALWQKREVSGEWQFVIVTPLVEEVGLKETYRRLDDILLTTPNRPEVDLLDLSILSPRARFSKSLHRELRNIHDRVVNKRPVGDQIIENGFIYFVK